MVLCRRTRPYRSTSQFGIVGTAVKVVDEIKEPYFLALKEFWWHQRSASDDTSPSAQNRFPPAYDQTGSDKSGVGRGIVFLAWGIWAAKTVAQLDKRFQRPLETQGVIDPFNPHLCELGKWEYC
ncbi:hypothetical protein EYR40_007914 [Pleurotus pulmonarius]|nr:hypothetical protein EYR40_007914 [Pleurotus pulmonarius]